MSRWIVYCLNWALPAAVSPRNGFAPDESASTTYCCLPGTWVSWPGESLSVDGNSEEPAALHHLHNKGSLTRMR